MAGRGVELQFKAEKLLQAGARTMVLTDAVDSGLRRLAAKHRGAIHLSKVDLTPANVLVELKRTEPAVVFFSTGSPALDEELAEAARSSNSGRGIICVVDDPRLNDFNMPAVACIGSISIGVSTGGRSPAMASVLRKRIEGTISKEDALQVRLQGELRKTWKTHLANREERKEFAYRLIHDKRIAALLKNGEYALAKRHAEEMLRRRSRAKA